MVYELGCRVGEFVRIQLKHLNFSRSTVFFPAENTKTRRKRTSHLPRGLMNEVISMLIELCRVNGTRPPYSCKCAIRKNERMRWD
jgi:integrase